MPRISVVVPSFNQGQFLCEALDSIFRQDYPDLEVVVMDGGSTDGSVDILRTYADRLTYWQSRPDGGQSAAINAGMRHCTGTLVAWLNSDDYYWGDAFHTVADAYRQWPNHGLYLGNGFRFDQRLQSHIPFCRRHFALNRAELAEGPDYILQPSALFLRAAWEDVGGLDPHLRFCMDWDIFLRIAQRYPAVLINEFLAVSREYEETKTRSGRLERAFEICRMLRARTGKETTTGALNYLIATLRELEPATTDPQLRADLEALLYTLAASWRRTYGHADGGFPETSDPQDKVYLPRARIEQAPAARSKRQLPSFSIVSVDTGEAAASRNTIRSIEEQNHPSVETIVVAARGLRQKTLIEALNSGLTRARGDVLGWLLPGDELSYGALGAIGQAFAEDPELGLVFGNALRIDEAANLRVVPHGTERTAFCYGDTPSPSQLLEYWTHSCVVPQPTLFFRRRLLEEHGSLDTSYRYLFDVELFWRYADAAKVRKIEKTLALCGRPGLPRRDHERAIRAEWYRFTRARWPSTLSPRWYQVLRGFVLGYVRGRFGHGRKLLKLGPAALVAASATLRLGNPETWRWPWCETETRECA